MIKILSIVTFLTFTLVVKSQNVSVDQSIFGVQTGVLGVWLHNERKLTDQLVLRSEFGLNAGIFGGSIYEDIGFLLAPVITLEPRWYYNLNKRAGKGRNTADNAGNFVSLQMNFNPDWFVISNYDNISVINQLAVIPTWGIKRNIGSHFNYETGIGIGYYYAFWKASGYSTNESGAAINLQIRIGYRFKKK